MRSYIINISAVVYAVVVFVAFEAGAVAPGDAFFAASILVTAYTGYQLLMREGMPLLVALKEIATRPDSYPRVTAYAAYIGSSLLGLMVAAQAVLTA